MAFPRVLQVEAAMQVDADMFVLGEVVTGGGVSYHS